jgi:hypothetical protein
VSDDEEVRELQAQARQLVGLAYRLSKDIDKTVDTLRDFAPRATLIDRRRADAPPYYGEERRSDPS